MMHIKYGMKIWSKVDIISRIMSKSVKTSLLNFLAASGDSTNFLLKIGIKTDERAPSPNNLLNKFGNLKAILTQSPIALEPKEAAINKSLARPTNLEIRVRKATIKPERNNILYCFVVSMSPHHSNKKTNSIKT